MVRCSKSGVQRRQKKPLSKSNETAFRASLAAHASRHSAPYSSWDNSQLSNPFGRSRVFAAPASPHQSPRAESPSSLETSPTSLCWRSKNRRHARTRRDVSTVSDKPQVAGWSRSGRSACVPESLALAGKAQLRKAIRPARGTSPPSGLDLCVGVSADLSHMESDAWGNTDMDGTALVHGSLVVVPGSRIGAESEFAAAEREGSTCWNLMAARWKASCSRAKSCLIDAQIEHATFSLDGRRNRHAGNGGCLERKTQ